MSNNYRIRTNRTTSTRSNEMEKRLDVSLEQTSKLAPVTNICDTLNVFEQYTKERAKSNKYRLIFTINPYCSNVLFNPITEIVKNEGSEEASVVSGDDKNDTAKFTDEEKEYIIGNDKPMRWEMVMNTEYSKPEIGYNYLPGYDMFTNHYFRNKTFKMVNHLKNKATTSNGLTVFTDEEGNENGVYDSTKSQDQRYIFNTIADNQRFDDTRVMKYLRRLRLPDKTDDYDKKNWRNKHIYDNVDLLSFEESIEENLTEDDGWIGFVNNSTIGTKIYKEGDDVGIETNSTKILNNREGCEFIDMYPDRTLFSFNPKYNDFRKRLEYNWDVCITFPYKNYYGHTLVQSADGVNGMKVLSVSIVKGNSGEPLMQFRTYVRHGLKRNDSFKLVVPKIIEDECGENFDFVFKVDHIGNISNNETEFYFSTRDCRLVEVLCGSDYFDKYTIEELDIIFQEKIKGCEFRYRRHAKGCDSEYYFRLFRKLPNLKKSSLSLTDEIAQHSLEDYVAKYVMDKKGKNTLLFENEIYRLAFARTIYNDISTQITFTDTIDVEHFIDNRNRPLTTLYLTVIKRNKGYKEWYVDNLYGNENVEYSHCFGKVTSGVEMSNEESDLLSTHEEMARMGDVRFLNNIKDPNLGDNMLYSSEMLEDDVTLEGVKLNGELISDCFLGDIVEYSPKEVEEHRLVWISHRFNTMQREMDEKTYTDFHYQEIAMDDYDSYGDKIDEDNFKITDYYPEYDKGKPKDITAETDHRNYRYTWDTPDGVLWLWNRPEGYYYRPHYEIPVKTFGGINQSSHISLSIKENVVMDNDRMYVTTKNKHGVSVGDIIIFRVRGVDKPYYGVVYDVYNEVCFTVVLDRSKYPSGTLQAIVPETIMDIRKYNREIPFYAENIAGTSIYMWRDILSSGDTKAADFPEYTFANGAFYIHTGINFYLKRQDPYGWNGMRCDTAFPNDIDGNKMVSSNYEYKDESFLIC